MRQTNDVVQWWSPKAAAAWQELAARIDELEQADAARERGAQRYLAALMEALREGRPAPSMEEFEAFGRGGGYSGNDLYDDLDSGSATVTNPSSTQASDHPDLPATNDRPQAGETSSGPPSVYAPVPGSADYNRIVQDGDASGLGVTPGSAVSSGVGTDSASRATAPATPWPYAASQGATSADDGARQGSGPSPASVSIDTLPAADAEQAWATAAAGQPASDSQATTTRGGEWSFDADANAADLAAHLQQHPLRPGRQDLYDFQHREQTGEPPGSVEDDLRRIGPLGRIAYHTAETFAQPVATAVDEQAAPLQRGLATLQAAGNVFMPLPALESAVAGAGTQELTGSRTLGTIASLAAPLAAPALLRGGAAVAGRAGQEIEGAGGLLPLVKRGEAILSDGTEIGAAARAVSRALGRDAEEAGGQLPNLGRGEMGLRGGEELPSEGILQSRPDPSQLVRNSEQVRANLADQAAIPGTRGSYVADPSGLAPAALQQEIANSSYVPQLAGLTDVAVRSLATTALSDAGVRVKPPPVDLLAWNGVQGMALLPFGRIQANPWGASLRGGAPIPPSEAAEEYTQTLLEELAHYATRQDHGQPAFEALTERIRHSNSPQIAQVKAEFEQMFTVLQQSPEYQNHVRALEALHNQWAASAPAE